MGIYADEHNTTPTVVCGGEFWLHMDWLRMGLLLVICILSWSNFFNSDKEQ